MNIRSAKRIAADALDAKIIPDDALLTTEEAASFLAALGRPFTSRSLENYRSAKPDVLRFHKHGKSVRYVAADLRRFAVGDRA